MSKACLSWKEIESNALAFAKEWKEETSENAESQTFWNEFFEIFGMRRRKVSIFEATVKKLTKISALKYGKIDLFWPNMLLVEHKSLGKDLEKAFDEAVDYALGIPEEILPRYLLVSDFANFYLRDLESKKTYKFKLKDLHKHIRLFGFIAGYAPVPEEEPIDPINQKAAEALGKLHERFKDVGYIGYNLEVFLVRLLFCLFAQCTGIFERGSFQKLILNTREDGKDTGARISHLFEVLNTESLFRHKNLDNELAKFEYINGDLFKELLPTVAFDSAMRKTLLDCCKLDWAGISPVIFGTLFQSIMDEKSRRSLGAHYTSEQNILKLIKPLFLDELWNEFQKIKKSSKNLTIFHKKLRSLTFLDPACGCGTFLIIAYRELRLLELEIIRAINEAGDRYLDIRLLVLVDVDQFYGIELEEFPAQIAQVALWLTDHQMNLKVSEEFGQSFARIPLRKSPHIVCANALRVDWNNVVSCKKLSYIFGNPPFKGPRQMNQEQREDVRIVFQGIKNEGLLDYVAAWFVKATNYLIAAQQEYNSNLLCAFVSTNSIVQGEQVSVLWSFMLDKGINIHFAHRTFQWNNEAKGVSAVHCVIIGFGLDKPKKPVLYEYIDLKGPPNIISSNHINPYLTDAPDILVVSRSEPLCSVPLIRKGCQPIDDGNYLFTSKEKEEFLKKEPVAESYFHRWLGADEFINKLDRWCLWLGDCPINILQKMPESLKLVKKVQEFRLKSSRTATLKLANTPTQFQVTIMPKTSFLVIPGVSAERRSYIPLGFESPDVIVGEKCLIIQEANMYHFGVLSSSMHMVWIRAVAGRMKSDYSYSAKVVYNNFPWPVLKQSFEKNIIDASERLISIRKNYNENSLADLYDPLIMPKDLLKAHQNLDREVYLAYGIKTPQSEARLTAFLFEQYSKLIKLI